MNSRLDSFEKMLSKIQDEGDTFVKICGFEGANNFLYEIKFELNDKFEILRMTGSAYIKFIRGRKKINIKIKLSKRPDNCA